jgi:hypothetical protein
MPPPCCRHFAILVTAIHFAAKGGHIFVGIVFEVVILIIIIATIVPPPPAMTSQPRPSDIEWPLHRALTL